MKEFSYLEDFDSLLARGTSRVDVPNAPTEYFLGVGDEEPQTFLGMGEYYDVTFSTQQAADNALKFVRKTLALVDENLSMSLKLSDVRDDVLKAVAKVYEFAYEGNSDPDPQNYRPAIEDAIRGVFDSYIATGDRIHH